MSWGVGAIRIFHSEGFAILRLLIKIVITLLSSDKGQGFASQLSLGCEWLFLQYSLFIHIICTNSWKKMATNSIQAILSENPLCKRQCLSVLQQAWVICSSLDGVMGSNALLFAMMLPLCLPSYFNNDMHDIIYSYTLPFWWLYSLYLLCKTTDTLIPCHNRINTSEFFYCIPILNESKCSRYKISTTQW